MRILSIDHGQKNIGLALTDETQTIAYPYKTLHNSKEVFDDLKKICKDENVGQIVVGLPIGLKGITEQTKIAQKFAEKLRLEINISVTEENEVLSTKMAEKRMAKGADIDQQAAVIILEGYLTKMR